jgi:WD40 repeat protein
MARQAAGLQQPLAHLHLSQGISGRIPNPTSRSPQPGCESEPSCVIKVDMTATAALAPTDEFLAHDNPVNHVAFGSDGDLMATADTAMALKVWRKRELVHQYDAHSILDKVRPTERIRGIRFSSDRARLYFAAGENVACFDANAQSDEPLWVYVAPRLFAFLVVSPTSISISEQDTLAAAFDNGTIAVWDSRGERKALIKHNAAPRYLTFLPDENILGTDSFSVSLWRADEKKPLWHRPSKQRIYGMAASTDGKYVALRRLWSTTVYNVEDGSEVVEHKQGRGLPLVAFGPTTHVLAVGTQHAIDLYDVSANTHVRLALTDAELISLTFYPDGTKVVAGCSDGRIRTWDNPLR